MKRQLVWMIAAILAICGTMTQTSCFSYEDEPVLDPNPQAQTLEGVWYTAYEAEGTIANPNREGDISYTHVVETYEFTKEGINMWNRYFFNEENDEPLADRV